MKFIKITENEHTKIMLDLESLTLPEMAVTADDVTLNVSKDSPRDYSFVNEFLTALNDDRAAILATSLINMQRAVNKHEDAEECAKAFADILTGLTQNTELNLIGSLREFSHNTCDICPDANVATIWYKPTREMVTVASLLSALCSIPLFNVLRYCHSNNNSRVSDIVYPVFENAIKDSGPAGKRFVNYIRDIVDTALGEKESKSGKDWIMGLIYINQFATNGNIFKRGISEYVICQFSKYVLSSYIFNKWVDVKKLEQTEKEAQKILSKRTMMSNDTLKK